VGLEPRAIGIGSREEEGVLGVQQWAEVRRLVLVDGRSQREVARLTGLARDTVAKAVASETPPKYSRMPAGSKLDPFKDWICEQLQADPTIQSLRLREMATDLGYEGGKSIFDDFVREVRPRFVVKRTFQRTIYRPGELAQCDLWEPREPIPVGYGQTRRGWVVTCELCWSRVLAGALIFSKEAPDILWGLGRRLTRIGALPEKLVWDREGAIAPLGRPTDAFAAFCGQLGVGWIILDPGDCQAKGALERLHDFLERSFEPARSFISELDYQDQLDRWFSERANPRLHRGIRAVPAERLEAERERMRPLPEPDARTRPPLHDTRPRPALPALGHQRLLARPASGRPKGRGPDLPARGHGDRARQRRARGPPPPLLRPPPDLHRPHPPASARAA
jgi:transposase